MYVPDLADSPQQFDPLSDISTVKRVLEVRVCVPSVLSWEAVVTYLLVQSAGSLGSQQ